MLRWFLDLFVGWRGDVSEDWIADQRRRELSAGVEQSGMTQWPIDKQDNEASRINRHRLRVRA